MKKAKMIARRGFSHKKKQNTAEAFEHASQSAAYGVETDIRITKDGVFVAFHDKSAARLSGRYKSLFTIFIRRFFGLYLRSATSKSSRIHQGFVPVFPRGSSNSDRNPIRKRW